MYTYKATLKASRVDVHSNLGPGSDRYVGFRYLVPKQLLPAEWEEI